VEFVLTALFLILFIIGIVELLFFIYTYNVLADSAKEGVRYAIVHGTGNTTCSGPGSSTSVPPITCSDASASNVITAVTNYAGVSMHSTAAMTITPTYPDSSSKAPSRVRVVVTYNYQPFFGLGWPTVTVNAAAEGRITY
jgi:hypothetical protein